jgi:hypothetical protein
MGGSYVNHPLAVCVVGGFGIGYTISDMVDRLFA